MIGFGHQICRPNFSREQRQQPFLFLGGGAELGKDFHIAGVRCGAVEDFGRPHIAAHDLCQRRILQVCQAGAVFAIFLGQEQVPKASRLGPFLERFQAGPRLPAVGRIGVPCVDLAIHRKDVGIDKGLQLVDQVLCFFGVIKEHDLGVLNLFWVACYSVRPPSAMRVWPCT